MGCSGEGSKRLSFGLSSPSILPRKARKATKGTEIWMEILKVFAFWDKCLPVVPHEAVAEVSRRGKL